MSTITFAIPTTTESDLHSFHAKHFPTSSKPSQFFISTSAPEPDPSNADIHESDDYNEKYNTEYEEEDLGTYPDGTPRTLTDDQIAMFRHSEIQTLLRERRRAREDASSDNEADVPHPRPADSVAKDQPEADESGEGEYSVTPEIIMDNPAATAKKKRHRGKKQKRKNRDRQWEQNNANQKRKWDEYIDDADGANAEAHTHRRRARELDEQRDENVELAY